MTELIDEFKAARGESGLIPSILVGVTLGSGNYSSNCYSLAKYSCWLSFVYACLLLRYILGINCNNWYKYSKVLRFPSILSYSITRSI